MIDIFNPNYNQHVEVTYLDGMEIERTVTYEGYYPSCMYDNVHLTENLPEIKKVVFSGPATIMFFEDGTKTVVKCDEYDIFDAEKGITLCLLKRIFNNKGKYYDVIKDAKSKIGFQQ